MEDRIHLFTPHESPFLSGLSSLVRKPGWSIRGYFSSPSGLHTSTCSAIGQQTAGPFGQGQQQIKSDTLVYKSRRPLSLDQAGESLSIVQKSLPLPVQCFMVHRASLISLS